MFSFTAAYDSDTVTQFYSKSRDAPLGKGAGEKIPPGKPFPTTLPADFRKCLSDMHVAPFYFRGDAWSSIEHVYHATEFIHEPDFYAKFTRHGAYGTNPHMAKLSGGKNGCKTKSLPRELRRPEHIKMDTDWHIKRNVYLLEAQLAKFRTHGELRKILLGTGDAQLNHFVRGRPPVICRVLMQARHELRAEASGSPAKRRRLVE